MKTVYMPAIQSWFTEKAIGTGQDIIPAHSQVKAFNTVVGAFKSLQDTYNWPNRYGYSYDIWKAVYENGCYRIIGKEGRVESLESKSTTTLMKELRENG